MGIVRDVFRQGSGLFVFWLLRLEGVYLASHSYRPGSQGSLESLELHRSIGLTLPLRQACHHCLKRTGAAANHLSDPQDFPFLPAPMLLTLNLSAPQCFSCLR